MSIIRIRKKENPFLIIEKNCIQDMRLSWKARGLLIYLLSMPDNWELRISDLINRSPDGRDAVYSILKELRRVGYIQHERARNADGTLGRAEYHVFEASQLHPENSDVEEDTLELDTAFPDMATPDMVSPDREKPDVYIINNINNTELNNKTAAATNNNTTTLPDSSPHAAAAFSDRDVLITDKLTRYQQMRVENLAAHWIHKVPYLTVTAFTEQIVDTLLSPNTFTLAGRDFHRKLNTIQKIVMSGKWTPPTQRIEKQLEAEQQKQQKYRKELQTAISDLNHWQKMQEFAASSGNQFEVERIGKLIQQLKTKVKSLQHEYQQREEAATI